MKTLQYILILFGTLLTLHSYSQTNVAAGKTGTFTQSSTSTLPVAVTDGNKTTLAMSITAYQNTPYITLDLGANYDLSSIKCFWGTSYYATNYYVSISSDNSTWISSISVTNNTANSSNGDLRTFSPLVCGIRYVKMTINYSNASNYRVDLYEIEIYGTTSLCINDGYNKKLFVSDVAAFNTSASFGGAITASSLITTTINSPTTMNLMSGGTNRVSIQATTGLVRILNDLSVSGTFTANGIAKFQNGNTTNMVISSDGKVGIGTTNNTVNGITYKLAVAGSVVATSIDIVGTVPAADYVFEQNYKLKSITELEKYVKNNKHLPDIPSAKEFKEKGYSIGKLDDLLLKKIEEITLYVIEQNKRIEALEKENQLLKNK